ncbi:hypothetical protein AMR42_05200 [Limnothrix sp. PR1529]|nr:hypothetical protein BCR12_15305 [Limnothrix sp. P13C2]PIB14568.1 hypothetical protein AMR42_05200 [Limnothrix sp. PR1529]
MYLPIDREATAERPDDYVASVTVLARSMQSQPSSQENHTAISVRLVTTIRSPASYHATEAGPSSD